MPGLDLRNSSFVPAALRIRIEASAQPVIEAIALFGIAAGIAVASARRTLYGLPATGAILEERECRLQEIQRITQLPLEEVRERSQGYPLEYLRDRLSAGLGWPESQEQAEAELAIFSWGINPWPLLTDRLFPPRDDDFYRRWDNSLQWAEDRARAPDRWDDSNAIGPLEAISRWHSEAISQWHSKPSACNGCGYFHGSNGIVCAVHPKGPTSESCVDWAS